MVSPSDCVSVSPSAVFFLLLPFGFTSPSVSSFFSLGLLPGSFMPSSALNSLAFWRKAAWDSSEMRFGSYSL